jgi:hypothetical protein
MKGAAESRWLVAAVAAILVAYGLSLALRMDAFALRTGAQGLEASYHVLWTVEALERSPAGAHRFLPTVTLEPREGNPVRWGATVPTAGGSYIYTSFPPLGFVLPMLALSPFSASGSLFALSLFNSLVGLAAAFGMAGLARSAALSVRAPSPESRRFGWTVFGFAGVCYLFMRESLVAHGSVYWAQSPGQLCLIFGAWAAFRLLQGDRSHPAAVGLLALGFVWPLLEWSGYVFNVGLVLAFAARRVLSENEGVSARRLFAAFAGMPLAIVLLTCAAGAVTLVHYFAAIGISEMLSALKDRAVVRTASPGAAWRLAAGYFVSVGALLPVALAALYLGIRRRFWHGKPHVWLLLFVLSFPLVENALMMQHAAEFSFDRLKLAVPLLVIVALYAASRQPAYGMPAFALFVALTIATNVGAYAIDGHRYRSWGTESAANARLLDRFRQDPLAVCSVYGAAGVVRGYLNLAFRRDIFELADVSRLRAHANSDGSCGLVLIRASNVFNDLPKITGIEVYDRSGRFLRRYD